MIANLKQMEVLTKAGDTEGLTALSTLMAAGTDKADACIAALETKSPGFGEKPEYNAALAKVCPDLAKLN